jgi:threonine dehydratase
MASRVEAIKRRRSAPGAPPFFSGANVYLKAENIQRTGSFKVRGSVNKLRKLAEERAVTEALGARVEIAGVNYDESRAAALEYADRQDSVFIDGFDDWDVIEGQATIGLELTEELGERTPDYVLIPAGGGGLMAGVLFYLKEIVY